MVHVHRYRTFFKPTYKVGYKTVTELEWRCCPGYSGENCSDGPTPGPDSIMPPFKGSSQGPRPGIKGFPWGHNKIPTPGAGLEPGKPLFPGVHRDNVPTGHVPSTGNHISYSKSEQAAFQTMVLLKLISDLLPLGPRTGVSGERLDRMEEDLRRLSQGLDTLNGLITGMEERLRVSLREDTTRMVSTLLGGPPRQPDSTVGFGVIPEGLPDTAEGSENFPVLGELVGRVTEVKDELRVKSHMLDEIHGMVMGHDGQLKRLMEVPAGGIQKLMEKMLDERLAGVRAQILDGFEKRLSGLENHCNERIGQVSRNGRGCILGSWTVS